MGEDERKWRVGAMAGWASEKALAYKPPTHNTAPYGRILRFPRPIPYVHTETLAPLGFQEVAKWILLHAPGHSRLQSYYLHSHWLPSVVVSREMMQQE